MKPTPTQHFDTLKPCEVRLLARRYGKRVTNKQIAKLAGMSIGTVKRLSRMETWSSIRIGVAERFAIACGHDLLRPRLTLQYIKRVGVIGRGFRHLTKKELRRLVAMLERLP